jgi:hypothetical protein
MVMVAIIWKKKPHTLEQFQNLIENIVGSDKIDAPNTQIHVFSLTWLGTSTSIKSGGVKLVNMNSR